MNIIKGLDRIALVLAIIAGPIGFYGGSGLIEHTFKTETTEHKEWRERIEQIWSDRPVGFPAGLPIELRERRNKEPFPKYNLPPVWQCIVGGMVSVPFSFFVVFFGVKITTRGTKKFSIWIIDFGAYFD